ncbi:hypothetical protein E5S70_26305 [Ensifer adhaerens]|nr:hypothetical protein [Ensifer canadensis]
MPLARSEICIEDLKGEKIISFSRQNLSFTERCFAEKFEAHDLAKSVAYTSDDTFSVVSLVSAGLGIGFAPEWTLDLPNRNFELRKVRGIDFRIGLGVAWSKDDPTAARDDIIEIARSRVRAGKSGARSRKPRGLRSLNQTERLAGPRPPGSRPLAVAMLILRDEAFNRSSRARTGSGSAAAVAWYAHYSPKLPAGSAFDLTQKLQFTTI